MVLLITQERDIISNTPISIIKTTVLSSFTFLSAIAIGNVFTKTMDSVLPVTTKEKLIYIYIYAIVVVTCTVVFAYLSTKTTCM